MQYVFEKPGGLVEKIKDSWDMFVIERKAIEIPDKQRLAQDKDYRRLTKELLKLVDNHAAVDDCLEFSAWLADSLKYSPVNIDDALDLVKKTPKLPFYKDPQENELYRFTKRILGALVEKCENRNQFYAKVEELQDAIVTYELEASMNPNFEVGVKVTHKNEIVNWKYWVTDYWGLEKKMIKAFQESIEKINGFHALFSYYAYPEEVERMDNYRSAWTSYFEKQIKQIKKKIAETPLPKNYVYLNSEYEQSI